jgi:glycosyltransferase involved in cell wall biosynthesis
MSGATTRRVPHLCHVFSTFSRGGPQVRAVDLINSFGGRFRHTVVAMDNDLACRDRVESAIDVGYRMRPEGTKGLRAPRWLANLLRSTSPDLVLSYNWGAIDAVLAALWTRVAPVVHAEDGFNPDEVERQKMRRVLTRRWVLPRVASVVVPSRTLETIARESWRVPPDVLTYVPNGVDLGRFRAGDARAVRERLGIPDDAIVVGTVGHLSGSKNVGHLLSAIADDGRLARVFALVVGDGPQRAGLESLARDLGIEDRVHFAGQVADPLPCYRAMDVFALASRTEQMPIAVLEAMAVSLPVVGTDVGDVKVMVAEENVATIVPPADRAAFTAALVRLVGDGRQRVALGEANRRRCADRYDLVRMRGRYEELYRGAISA